MSVTRLPALAQAKQAGHKIACLTAYDATFAARAVAAGTDALLVGDSLGMVLHGEATTLHVRPGDMVYHCRITRAGAPQTPLIADLPFACAGTVPQALGSATRLLQEGRADMVKLEGGSPRLEAVRAITAAGIPVCGHLGMLPQSVLTQGGYRRLRPDAAAARVLRDDALRLQDAGAQLLVLECVPRELAATITTTLTIPVIGIGAGADCDGQVLVLHDLLGLNPDAPFFSHDFVADNDSIATALADYVQRVHNGCFPEERHGYSL